MARVTVDDCLAYVDNAFELVLKASERARQLQRGEAEPLVPEDRDKPTVIALREIAMGEEFAIALAEQAAAAEALANKDYSDFIAPVQSLRGDDADVAGTNYTEVFERLSEGLAKPDGEAEAEGDTIAAAEAAADQDQPAGATADAAAEPQAEAEADATAETAADQDQSASATDDASQTQQDDDPESHK